MGKIISVHEYTLRREAVRSQFESAVCAARDQGLLALPGLERAHLLKGVRGQRSAEYAAVWTYESREAWERLWGPTADPCGRDDYPRAWRTWEDQILAGYLAQEPDKIAFTAYEELP